MYYLIWSSQFSYEEVLISPTGLSQWGNGDQRHTASTCQSLGWSSGLLAPESLRFCHSALLPCHHKGTDFFLRWGIHDPRSGNPGQEEVGWLIAFCGDICSQETADAKTSGWREPATDPSPGRNVTRWKIGGWEAEEAEDQVWLCSLSGCAKVSISF